MSQPCRQCPGRAGSVPACDCVPDTLAESWLCAGSVPAVPAVSRPCRQCPGVRLCPRYTGRVLAVFRPCRQCSGRAGSVPAVPAVSQCAIVSQTHWQSPCCVSVVPAVFRPCRQCSSRAGSVPVCDCVPDTLAEFWLCRQCPDVCPSNVTLSFVSRGNKIFRQVLFFSSSDPRSSRCYQSWSRAPFVTNWGVCQGPISYHNEQTQSVEGII